MMKDKPGPGADITNQSIVSETTMRHVAAQQT